MESSHNKGLSNTVGVLLILALTVVLAGGLVATLVDLGGNQETGLVAVDDTSETSRLQLRIVKNGESDSVYANGLKFPSTESGTAVQPLPDKDGRVGIYTEKNGDYTYLQSFTGDPIVYDLNGSISLSFGDTVELSSSAGSVQWLFGGTGGQYTVYKCITQNGDVYTVVPYNPGCTMVSSPPESQTIQFAGEYRNIAFVALDSTSGDVVGLGGIASSPNSFNEDETAYTFQDDGTTSNAEPLIGYDGQVITFEFRDDSNNLQSVDWNVTEENGAGINQTAPDGVAQFDAKLELTDSTSQGNFVMTAKDGTGTVVDKKRVIVLPADTSEYTYSGSTVDGSGSGGSETVSGDASINPQISGETVKAYNGSTVVDTATTDSNGEYTVSSDNITKVKLTVEGFEDPELPAPLYGSASRSVAVSDGSEATVNFTFVNSSAVELDSNGDGSDELIGTTVEETDNTTTRIGTVEELQAMKNNKYADYELVRDIDASETSSWNSGKGFDPVELDGSFNGNNHTISSLYINRSSYYVGLFSSVTPASDVKLKNVNITGKTNVGGLAGSGGSIENVHVEGEITGESKVGGLVGSGTPINNSSANVTVTTNGVDDEKIGGLVGSGDTVRNSYSKGTVKAKSGDVRQVGGLVGRVFRVKNSNSSVNVTGGDDDVGGLVGSLAGGSSVITGSYSTGDVDVNGAFVGGLVGSSRGKIEKSYSTSTVTHSDGSRVGGLVGDNNGGVITRSFATGNITADREAGALVGRSRYTATINKSYATGDVEGSSYVGGLVGVNAGKMKNTYASGDVTNSSNPAGGVVGKNKNFRLNDSYWNTEKSGQSERVGESGLPSPRFEQVYSGDGTGRWVRVTIDFDHANDEVTYKVEDLSSGTTKTRTFSTNNANTDIESIQIRDFDNGETYMWFDNFTVDTGSAIATEDYESGSLDSEWSVNDYDFGIKTGNVYEGSYSAGIESSYPSTPISTWSPSELSGGVQTDKITFYWYENSSSYGGSVIAQNPSGENVVGFATDNPQWNLYDSQKFGVKTFEMQGSDALSSMEGFDFSNTWNTISGDYPVLQDIEEQTQLDAR